MCFQSVYKRLKCDFKFLNEYGYNYECDVKHNVQPYVKFRNEKYTLLIGFAYDENRFFVSFFDDNVREFPSEWNLKAKGVFKDGWAKPIYVVDNNTDLKGKGYKGQLAAVKEILICFLKTIE